MPDKIPNLVEMTITAIAQLEFSDAEELRQLRKRMTEALEKHVKDAAREAADTAFLRESGLLFEVNRKVLHPYGLGLMVEYDSADRAGPVARICGLQRTDDPAGMHFADAGDSISKLQRFEYLNRHRIEARRKALGDVVQSLASCAEK
jgi:hypothetical protein